MLIGVLALQGAFAEHRSILQRLGVESFEIRCSADLSRSMDGLILPGGESTVMGKLLGELGMMDPLRQRIGAGLPVFGTCAGMILLAAQLENDPSRHLATMDITVKRNAYGRQAGSFRTTAGFADARKVPMVFIRAPYITGAGPGIEVLSVVNGRIVAARQANQLVTAFHPELADDPTVHDYFLTMVGQSSVNRLYPRNLSGDLS